MKKLLLIPLLLIGLAVNGQIINTAPAWSAHYLPAISAWTSSSFANGIVWAETSDSITWDSISNGVIASEGYSFPLNACVGCITEMQTYYDAMTTPWTGDTIGKMNDFFDSLDQNSYLANVHLMYWFGGHIDDDGDALINAANPGTYNATNGTGDAAATLSYGGYTGDGGDSILTNYNPTTASLNQDAATIIVYTKADVGGYAYYAESTNIIQLYTAASGTAIWKLNATLNQNYAMTGANALWINTRRDASDIEAYKNGSTADTETDASTGVPDDNILLLNSGAEGSSHKILFFMVLNQGLTDDQEAQIAGFINTFATYIGENEY